MTMEKLKKCRICLVENVRMNVLADKTLQDIYEKLTDVPFVTEDSRPTRACFVCCDKLKQCYQLQRKCLEAEELFTQMLNGDYEIKPLINEGLFHRGINKTSTDYISIVDECQTESITIKEELPAVCKELDDIIQPKEEHHSDELELENLNNSCLDVADIRPHHSDSDLEDDVPLMEIKIEVEEEQELPAVCEERDNMIKPKEEHQSDDELEMENFNNTYLDVVDIRPHHSESDSEDDVPLMEFKTEVEEEQEVFTMKQRSGELKNITNAAKDICKQLLPEKSRKSYEKAYQDFMNWKISKRSKSFSEDVLIVYFQELSEKFKSSTLWTFYSMLKSTLSIIENVDISKYSKLIALLKRKSEGSISKKSKTLLPAEINKFLSEAPDQLYLSVKIALIFGTMGACSRQELYALLYTDVKINEAVIVVNINNRKTKVNRTFTVTGKYLELCKKYIALRPVPCRNPCFFLQYRSGKCTSQRIGINTFSNLAKTIANYLELPNPELYTGHCFRRTSATLLVDARGVISSLKRHGEQARSQPKILGGDTVGAEEYF